MFHVEHFGGVGGFWRSRRILEDQEDFGGPANVSRGTFWRSRRILEEQEDFGGPVFDAESTQFRQNVSRGTFLRSRTSSAAKGHAVFFEE